MFVRDEIRRLGISLTPALVVTVLGAVLAHGVQTADSAWWQALSFGGQIALMISVVAGLLIAVTQQAHIMFSAIAAITAFVLRIGGAGIAVIALTNHPFSSVVLGALAGCLTLSIGLDLWIWLRLSHQHTTQQTLADAPLTSAKESARA
jgi:hypothetical protein